VYIFELVCWLATLTAHNPTQRDRTSFNCGTSDEALQHPFKSLTTSNIPYERNRQREQANGRHSLRSPRQSRSGFSAAGALPLTDYQLEQEKGSVNEQQDDDPVGLGEPHRCGPAARPWRETCAKSTQGKVFTRSPSPRQVEQRPDEKGKKTSRDSARERETGGRFKKICSWDKKRPEVKEAREGASGVPSDNNEGPAVDAQVERFRRQAPAARGGAHANRRSWLLLQIAVVFFLFCYFCPCRQKRHVAHSLHLCVLHPAWYSTSVGHPSPQQACHTPRRGAGI